jgi:hypothetical protein
MNKQEFIKMINHLQEESDRYSLLYKNGIDVLNLTEGFHSVITILGESLFSKEGWDWITWFCYETNFGKNNLEAWDEHKNPICYDIDSLYEFLVQMKYIKSSVKKKK